MERFGTAFIKLLFSAAFIMFIIFTYHPTAYGADFTYKNVLILNSYHEGLTWTDEESDGILSTLKNSGINCSVAVEYMDWKHYPYEQNLKNLHEYYKYKYTDKKIDIVITTDDTAFEFALKNRQALFFNAPVVFCGVNKGGFQKISKGYFNLTGILEEVDPENTIKMALEINPALKNVYLIYDNTESGISTGELTKDAIKKVTRDMNIIRLNGSSYSQIVETVKSADKDSIVLITSYSVDAEGMSIEFEDFSRVVSLNSTVPVFHLYDFGLENGAIGGSMISGRLHGKNAAMLAVRILSGEYVNSIPVQNVDSIRKSFDYAQLKRFNIPLSRVPKDAILINKPFSFVEAYEDLVYSTITLFILLILFISILLFYIKKIRTVRAELRRSNEELSALYEELTATDEELRQQFDELTTAQDMLQNLAYNDSLTGLLNRLSLYEKLPMLLKTSSTGKSALMFIDTDNFKLVNDVMGHVFGDMMIKHIGNRLSSALGSKQKLFRIGGDEFVIYVNGYKDITELDSLASFIINAFNEPITISDSKINVSISMGISLYPEHGSDINELLKNADIAMYKAKSTHKGRYVFYNTHMNTSAVERMQIEKYLPAAVENKEFILHYQPRIDINKGTIAGFEALIRWNSPELGLVPPERFIEIAEENRQIIAIGEWVLKSACMFNKNLREQGYLDYTISVNISIIQLMQDDFCNIITDTLESLGLPPNCLELEITESILMESFEVVNKKLGLLRNKGIGIALDDFGKGYSSLNYLRQLPITTLKIDKSFIDCISYENNNISLIDTIVSMGHKIGLVVVAEGVEREEQLKYLEKCGCNEFQGYLFSKPIPEDKVIDILIEHIA